MKTCRVCDRPFPSEAQEVSTLCEDCFALADLENGLGKQRRTRDNVTPERDRHYATILAAGGNARAVRNHFRLLFGKQQS